LAAALALHRGNRRAAGRELGVLCGHLSYHIGRSKPDSPLYPFRNENSGNGIRKVPEHAIVDALRRHAGNRTHAAAEVGLTPQVLTHHIGRAAPEAPLAEFKDKSGLGATGKRHPDEDVAAVLDRNGGRVPNAAAELEMSHSGLYHRLRTAEATSPLEVAQAVARGPRTRRLSCSSLAPSVKSLHPTFSAAVQVGPNGLRGRSDRYT